VTVDTLVIALPRRRAIGLAALAVGLIVVAVLSDPGGRLLAVPAALAVLAVAVRDLRSGPVLRAGPDGVDVLQGLCRLQAPWDEVERLRVVRDRRTEVLELDLGRTLALLSRARLGQPPADVLELLLTIRASAAAAPRSPERPGATPG
jgi:hypothetical protein